MTGWGDRTIASWGAFTWGDFLFFGGDRFFGDMVGEKFDNDAEFDADYLAQQTINVDFDGDFVGLAFDQDRRFDADMFVSRLPTDRLSQRSSKPVVLIQIDLPDGTLRVSSVSLTAAGFGWSGLIRNAPQVSRALGETTDDLRLVLVDNAVSSRFTDANPPEGSLVQVFLLDLDDIRESLLPIFNGRIEQVVDVGSGGVGMEVVRSDDFLDRLIGRLVTTTDFPGAPNESLGKMLPIVYGQPAQTEGRVVRFNRTSGLRENIDEIATTLRVQSGAGFPSSGKIIIDDEIIFFAFRTLEVLQGLTRGDDGTVPAAHPSGSSVSVLGTFEVRFADHPVTNIAEVQLMDEGGTLVTADQLPTVDTANGRVTWDRTPTVEMPSRSTETILIGFEVIGSGNNALNPLRAAREGGSYSDLNFALASPASGRTLSLQRVTNIAALGKITRVGMVVVFDPSAGTGSQAIIGGGGVVGTLVNSDTTPAWAVRRVERQMKQTYEIQDPTHSHPTSTRQIVVRPRTMLTRNVNDDLRDPSRQWVDPVLSIDGDPNTGSYTLLRLSGAAEAIIARDADLNLAGIASDETIVNGFFRAWAGPPIPGGGVALTGRITIGFNPAGAVTPTSFNSPLRVTIPLANINTQFVSPTVPGSVFPSISDFPNALWVAQPNDPLVDINGDPTGVRWMVRNMELVLSVGKVITPASTNVSQRRSVTNFFDITDRVQGNWSFFNGRSIQVTNPTQEDLRINTVYFAVEFRPTIKTAIEVPRVFGEIRGKLVNGEPTEILKDIITTAAPQGMGLDPNVITQGVYAKTRAALAADGMRADFNISKQISSLKLISKLSRQADLRQWWDAGRHFVSRKPDPDNLDDVFRIIRTSDVRRGTLQRSRTGTPQIVNRIEARFREVPSVDDLTLVSIQQDAPSQTRFGLITRVEDFDLLLNPGTADLVASRMVARRRTPRWIVVFQLPLFGLELRRGDLIELQHNQFTFAKGEVLTLPITLSREKVVRVTAIVWEA